MASNRIPLSKAAILALPTPVKGKNKIYRFADSIPGLAIRVTDTGSKHYVYCYTTKDLDSRGMRVERRVALGVEFTKADGGMAAAEAEATKMAAKIVEGQAPETKRQETHRLRAEKQVSEQEITVGRLIDRYMAEWSRPNKKRWKEDESRLNQHVRPVWGQRKVRDITRADVDALVAPVATGDEIAGIPPRPAEANHRLAGIRKMFSFAVDKGIITNHPCLRMKAPGGKIAPRQRALTTARELRLLWRVTDSTGPWVKVKKSDWPKDVPWEARGRMNPTIADALRFVLATGCRANEATALTWSELDLEAGEWVLPAKRSKNKRALLIPLLPQTVAMLRARREVVNGDYVFPSKWYYTNSPKARDFKPHINDKHLSEALGHACSRLEGLNLAPFTTHDLRRTVETGMAAARVPKEFRDRVLNHIDSSVGTTNYNVHDYKDEKREALEKWAARLEGMLRPAENNVVQLRRVQG